MRAEQRWSRGAPLVVVLVALVLAIAVGTGGSLQAAGAPDPAAPPTTTATGAAVAKGGATDPAAAASSTPAEVPAEVSDAVAEGPVEVIVSYAPNEGVEQLEAATAGSSTKARRAAGAKAAAETYADQKDEALARAGAGAEPVQDFDHLPAQVVRVDTPEALERLAGDPNVIGVHLPKRYSPVATGNLELINQPEAVTAGHTGAGTTVAVIDSGIDGNRPNVGATFGDCSGGINTGTCRVRSFHDMTGTGIFGDIDPAGHGTNVAGVVANTATQAKLAIYAVFTVEEDGLTTSSTDVLEALNHVASNAAAANIRAVNLSLGAEAEWHMTECTASPFSPVFVSLKAQGVITAVASGNNAYDANGFHNGVSDPACARAAVRVGAVYHTLSGTGSTPFCTDTAPNPPGEVTCFSQTGPLLSVLAPGINITAAGITMHGTSQAAPHVAAGVAMLYDANPQATPAQVVRAITTTGSPITDPKAAQTTRLLDLQAAAVRVQEPLAVVTTGACTGTTLSMPEDADSATVALPSPINFHGTTYNQIHLNQNGHVTFEAPDEAWAPVPLTANVDPIIAPFFADVDPVSGSRISRGTTTFLGRPAFCVTWDAVGYWNARADKRNRFQLLLVDRNDVAPAAFDIVFNYDEVAWEAGDDVGIFSNGFAAPGLTAATAGYSAGDGNGTHALELPGRRTPGGFLDTNATTGLANVSTNSIVRGRHVFEIRSAPAVADRLQLVAPSSATTGSAFDVTVRAVNSGNSVDVTVNGPVTLTSTDPAATLPAGATLTNGQGTFPVTLNTAGSSTITASRTGLLSDTSDAISVTPPPSPADVRRVSGNDRIATAIASSQSSYPSADSAGAVVLASAQTFPDGLAGTPLADAKNAPMLLTDPAALPASVLTEIRRVLPAGATVYVLGGTAAVSDTVTGSLTGDGFVVQRLAGADRFATAVAIADAVGSPQVVLLATGFNFPDALSAGVAAAYANGVVLFTQGTTQAPATQTWLNAHGGVPVVIVGGTAAGTAPGATLLSGADRYATSVEVAEHFFPSPTIAGVASGTAFPDALSGGAHIAKRGGPILLTQSSGLPSAVNTWFVANKVGVAVVYVYGGTAAVSATVANQIASATS